MIVVLIESPSPSLFMSCIIIAGFWGTSGSFWDTFENFWDTLWKPLGHNRELLGHLGKLLGQPRAPRGTEVPEAGFFESKTAKF